MENIIRYGCKKTGKYNENSCKCCWSGEGTHNNPARPINPDETSARESVLDELVKDAQENDMGYESHSLTQKQQVRMAALDASVRLGHSFEGVMYMTTKFEQYINGENKGDE